MASLLNEETPGFDFIEVSSEDPFVLFNEWYQEAQNSDITLPRAFTLATVGKDGKPGARSLLLRRLDSDGFVFTTNKDSKKAQELTAVPNAAMVFFWGYKKNDARILQQVRVEGRVAPISAAECQALFDQEPVFAKMRSHLCAQGNEVEWQQMQDNYIKLLGQVKSGQQLTMPDDFVGYKLSADVMEFYMCTNCKIADRILFKKNVDGNSWSHHRIAA